MIEKKVIVARLVDYIASLGLSDDVAAELSSRGALVSDRIKTDLREVVREELSVLLRGDAPKTDKFMTAEEAAEVAAVDPATVRRWVNRGELPGHYAGRLLRVRLDELRAYLSRDRSTGEPVDVDRRVAEILGGLGHKR
jgi:excisionase family DNA binding protein